MATTRYALTPESAHFPSTNFAALTALANGRFVLAFDKDTDEAAMWSFVAPQGLSGALSAVLFLASSTGSAAAAYWEVSVEAITPADAQAVGTDSFDTANTGNITMPATTLYENTLSVTLTNADSIAAGDHCRLRVSRDANNGSDAYAYDAYLTLVEIREA